MSGYIDTLTADHAADTHVVMTRSNDEGISLAIPSSATFGGGTLALKARPATQQDQDYIAIADITGAETATYSVGADMDVAINLSGASSPNIPILIGRLGG